MFVTFIEKPVDSTGMFFLKKYGIVVIIFGLLALGACSELPCSEINGVQLYAGFYHFDGTTLTDTVVPDLIMHYGLEEQSIYSETLRKVQRIQFPLSMLADSSVVIFEFDSVRFDTLVFHYNKMLHLESHECGFVDFFEITSIEATAHEIDSVWISKNVVDYGDKENIKIYF